MNDYEGLISTIHKYFDAIEVRGDEGFSDWFVIHRISSIREGTLKEFSNKLYDELVKMDYRPIPSVISGPLLGLTTPLTMSSANYSTLLRLSVELAERGFR